MLKRLKRTTLGVWKRLGVFELVAGSAWRRARLLILGYHGISQQDEHEWDPELYMAPDQFRARLSVLRNGGYHVLPLHDALRRLHAKSLPPRAVAITFDDGYVDFYTRAYPILAEFGYPATVYLTTYYCEYNRPVFDVVCSYLLWKGRRLVIDGQGLVEGGGALDLRTTLGRDAARAAIRRFAKSGGWSAREKDAVANDLATRVGVDYDALTARRLLHLMRPEEVRALPRDLVDVQLHTHRHRTPRSRPLFRGEILDNQQRLEAITPAAAARTHFCYPSGDYCSEFLPWLRELGVEWATTCDVGIVSARTDPLLLPRLVDTSSLSDMEFEAWAAGVATVMPKRERAAALVE